MLLYKYRDLSENAEFPMERLYEILFRKSFWCAKPDTLNDKEEFIWSCDYTPTDATAGLLATILIKNNGRSSQEALVAAQLAIASQRLEEFARPQFKAMMDQCRREVGLLCLGSSFNNEVLWDRYGAGGAGVCIEIDIPDEHARNSFRPVEYLDKKVLHVDQLLAAGGGESADAVYKLSLLTKPTFWAPEKEYRFISKQQCINVNINGAAISKIFVGHKVSPKMQDEVAALIDTLPYRLPIVEYRR